jgi:putative membrane protein
VTSERAPAASLDKENNIMKITNTAKLSAIAAVALALSASTLLGADRENRGQLSSKDYKFVSEAVRGGTTEVELGQLAAQKASTDQARTFGQRMVTDHKRANEELETIASRKGATLPAKLSHSENSEMSRLQKSTGADFDKAYAKHMVKDHETDVKDFEDAAKNLDDAELRAFAQKTLPTLQEHLRMARDLEAQTKR